MARYTIDVEKVGYTLLRRREIWHARVWVNSHVGGWALDFQGSSYDDVLDRAKRWCDSCESDPPRTRVEYTPPSAEEAADG